MSGKEEQKVKIYSSFVTQWYLNDKLCVKTEWQENFVLISIKNNGCPMCYYAERNNQRYQFHVILVVLPSFPFWLLTLLSLNLKIMLPVDVFIQLKQRTSP
jgi:hypothetical protein